MNSITGLGKAGAKVAEGTEGTWPVWGAAGGLVLAGVLLEERLHRAGAGSPGLESCPQSVGQLCHHFLCADRYGRG